MPRTKKSTKKFVNNKLKDTLQERKNFQKRQKQKESKKRVYTKKKEDDFTEDEGASLSKHKNELDRLKESQKDFFEFLQKNDPGLLDLEESSEDVEDVEDAVDDELTMDMLNVWKEKAIDCDVKSMKFILDAFRIACHVGEDDDQFLKFKFSILDSEIFNDVILFCLDNMADIFDIILQRYENEDPEDENSHFVPNRSNKWKTVKRYVKILVSNTVHFLNQLSEPSMIVYVLNKFETMTHYLGVYPKIARKLLKKCLSLWEGSSEAVRIAAYVNIRSMALKMPYPMIDDCLKGIYLTFVRNMKHYNEKNVGMINFLTNCVIDIYGLDFSASYQHAFVYIRELGIHLRQAFATKSKDSHTSIYNWQTFYSIKVWVNILSNYPQQEAMKLLVFPLIQILQGVITFVPTPRYYPARMHLIGLLNELNKAYPDTYINTASYIMEVIGGPLLSAKRKKKYTGKPIQITNFLKAPEYILNTISYQNTILTDCHDLLLDYLSIYSKSIAFPELILPIMMSLKRFVKHTKSPFFNKKFKTLMDKINLNAKYILAKRNVVDFSPADTDKVEGFLSNTSASPLEKYIETGLITRKESGPEMDNNNENEEYSEESQSGEEDLSAEQPPRKKRRIEYENLEDDLLEDLILSSSEEDSDVPMEGDSTDESE